jgi:16S rRNA processing protein RimM
LTGRDDALVHIGTIVGPLGLRGAARVATADSNDFVIGLHVFARTGGQQRSLQIAAVRPTPASFSVTFAGIDTAGAVEALRGAALFAKPADLPALAANVYRVEDLLGMCVRDRRLGELGIVREVRPYPQCHMLVVGDRLLLIPMLQAFGVNVDAGARTIETRLPDGFEEL